MLQRAGGLQKPCCSHRHSRFLGERRPCLVRQNVKRTRKSLEVRASLTNKGKRFSTSLIAVKKIMGEGSYGQVFEVFRLFRGSWHSGDAMISTHGLQGALAGREGPERVVLKRVKQRVQV